MLQRGDRGADVAALQDALVSRGLLSAEARDSGPGIYGPRTEAAVRAFKAARVDGIADDQTLAQLGLVGGPATPLIDAVVDLSHHNADPDFAAAAAAGIIGVIYKASQGLTYRDPTYAAARKAARDAGLLWGAYHFGTGDDGADQAAQFLQAAAPDGETLLVLDFEHNPTGSSMMLEQAEAFVTTLITRTGRAPGFYSGNDIKEQLGNTRNALLGQCWFWLAQYGPRPVVPPNWDTWTFWQYTDGHLGQDPQPVAGIGPCDRDRFNGDADALRTFWQIHSV